MKGQHFKGWGYMRFWLTSDHVRGRPSRNGVDMHEGDGDTGEFPGVIHASSWQEPYRSALVSMDAMPRGVFSH